jgi:CheY-like chemotaxis protein
MAEVLIVDDDQDIAEIAKVLLSGEGYEVRIAANGEEGLRALQERLPDVVLLDIEMPILDGPGMVYRMFIHDLGMDEIPVVLSSGAERAPEVAREIGTPYVLGKPFGYRALSRAIRQAITEGIPPRLMIPLEPQSP